MKVSGFYSQMAPSQQEKVCCVGEITKPMGDRIKCTFGDYLGKYEALIVSILTYMLDLVFPSKPWAPNVQLVKVGLVTSKNLEGT